MKSPFILHGAGLWHRAARPITRQQHSHELQFSPISGPEFRLLSPAQTRQVGLHHRDRLPRGPDIRAQPWLQLYPSRPRPACSFVLHPRLAPAPLIRLSAWAGRPHTDLAWRPSFFFDTYLPLCALFVDGLDTLTSLSFAALRTACGFHSFLCPIVLSISLRPLPLSHTRFSIAF